MLYGVDQDKEDSKYKVAFFDLDAVVAAGALRDAAAAVRAHVAALMQNNWALQSGTSHFLGQFFARAFDVNFPERRQPAVAVATRSLRSSTFLAQTVFSEGTDGRRSAQASCADAVAPTQVFVNVPFARGPRKDPEGHASLMAYVDKAVGALKAAGVRVDVDDRFNLKPGPKFYEAERRGIPLRIAFARHRGELAALRAADGAATSSRSTSTTASRRASCPSSTTFRRRCSRRRSSGWPTARSRATRTRR